MLFLESSSDKTAEDVVAGLLATDLWAPCFADRVLQVRAGKMKAMPGLEIESGIDKTTHSGAVKVSRLGLDGDEHDPTFHGGIDKAVHGYCASHYASWQREFPSAASRFVPGGFGENLVLSHMNERSVCIGDIVAVGDVSDITPSSKSLPPTAWQDHFHASVRGPGSILQVSLPRQPCFKLNHRFQLKNFGPETTRASRTGWYYRVIREGTIRAGDQVRVLARPNPTWTIERIQEFLYRNTGDAAMNAELAELDELGAESRRAFRKRVEKEQQRMKEAQGPDQTPAWRDFRIVAKTRETARVVSVTFESTTPLADPDDARLGPGACARIRLGNGLTRTYSLVGGDRNGFRIGVALAEGGGRGGSRWIHEKLGVGDVVQVGAMNESIEIPSASNHVFIAGGIGVTAFLGLVDLYQSINYDFKLHLAVRSGEDIPFRAQLRTLGDSRLAIYDKSKGQRLNVKDIVDKLTWNAHLYVCGPRRMMDEVAAAVQAKGMDEREVHYEAFEADVGGDPFDVVVANRENKQLRVGEEETLLEVLRKHFDVPSTCEAGNCGTCKVRVQAGKVEHRGSALTEKEKKTCMLSCVSRGLESITVEI